MSLFRTNLSLALLATLPVITLAFATPVLPDPTLAEQAVQAALSEPEVVAARKAAPAAVQAVAKPVPAPVKSVAVQAAAKPAPAPAKPAPTAVKPAAKPVVKAAPAKTTVAKAAPAKSANAEQLRRQGVAQAQRAAAARGARTAVVRATAYNSIPNQTDASPFITATGTRTRFGVVALSRDLLRKFPYGTRIRLEDPTGQLNGLLAGRVFIVEDTMHPRKYNHLDVWMSSRSQALQFGARQLRITAID